MSAGVKRGARLLNFGRSSVKVTKNASNLPADVAASAQALRMQLQTQDHSGGIASSSADSLIRLAESVYKASKESTIPQSVFRLINRTLERTPNYKGELSPQNLQLLFRAVTSRPEQLDLATRLYMDVYHHSRISHGEKLENGLAYYALLRQNMRIVEALQMIGVLLKENAGVVTEDFISKVLDVTASTNPDANSFVVIIEKWPTTEPSSQVLTQTIRQILAARSVEGLDRLATYLYFENPHYRVSADVAIVLLDAFLQLPAQATTASGMSGGHKVLQICLTKRDMDTSLEVLELLLMSCMHLQEPVSTGAPIHDCIRHNWSSQKDYTKETWDILCQWAVYRAEGPSLALQHEVLAEMPSEFIDSQTLTGILTIASEKAQCGEAQISDLVEYFQQNLGITPDAASTAVLIRRALRSFEVERARQLFTQSNTDWNVEDSKHTPVLSDLLIAMCRTPSISRQAIMDTYQRVGVFVRRLSYEAQIALLKMFLEESGGESTPAGIFLIDQFGDLPNLRFEDYREIYDLFSQHIMASSEDTKAWNLFGILNCTVKLPYEAYYPFQQKFCDLGRPDVAHVMFRHLRTRVKAGEGIRSPGAEMYAMLFAEYAKWRYEEGTHELDTYFRMDLNNEMSPAMLNRMLMAYASLGDNHKMANLWAEALSLPRGGVHGPNNETMTIMLHYFTRSLGLEAVDDLWAEIPTRFRLVPTIENLKQYVVANCYHGYYMRALEIVKKAPEAYSLPITDDILQALYNWTLLPQRKKHVREFALESFPELWRQLEARPGALKDIVLPPTDDLSDYDEPSLRFEAIRQLDSDEKRIVLQK